MARYFGGNVEFEALDDDPSGRLDELRLMIKEAIRIARDIVDRLPSDGCQGRAKAYWIPQICIALDDDHDWMNRGMCTMQETINDLADLADCDEEDHEE